jgi:hypothetical protein
MALARLSESRQTDVFSVAVWELGHYRAHFTTRTSEVRAIQVLADTETSAFHNLFPDHYLYPSVRAAGAFPRRPGFQKGQPLLEDLH